jgi:hypothetical protein
MCIFCCPSPAPFAKLQRNRAHCVLAIIRSRACVQDLQREHLISSSHGRRRGAQHHTTPSSSAISSSNAWHRSCGRPSAVDLACACVRCSVHPLIISSSRDSRLDRASDTTQLQHVWRHSGAASPCSSQALPATACQNRRHISGRCASYRRLP